MAVIDRFEVNVRAACSCFTCAIENVRFIAAVYDTTLAAWLKSLRASCPDIVHRLRECRLGTASPSRKSCVLQMSKGTVHTSGHERQ